MKRMLFSLLLLCLGGDLFAQALYDRQFEVDERGYVKDRYFIGFHPRTDGARPLVLPPNPANKVPCCLHSSGQDPAEIEQALQLDGEVLAIFDTINAVYVDMSAEEAERVRADPRVLYVEQDMMMLTVGGPADTMETSPPPSDFENNPALYRLSRHYMLSLPFIDADIPGMYQDARIEYVPATGTWRLERYTQGLPVALKDIERVDVIVTEDMPVQAFVEIEGTFDNSCQGLKNVALRRTGNTFELYAFYRIGTINCAATPMPFTKIVPLPLYGLTAGEYTYTVNGEFPGVVILDRDNVLE